MCSHTPLAGCCCAHGTLLQGTSSVTVYHVYILQMISLDKLADADASASLDLCDTPDHTFVHVSWVADQASLAMEANVIAVANTALPGIFA